MTSIVLTVHTMTSIVLTVAHHDVNCADCCTPWRQLCWLLHTMTSIVLLVYFVPHVAHHDVNCAAGVFCADCCTPWRQLCSGRRIQFPSCLLPLLSEMHLLNRPSDNSRHFIARNSISLAKCGMMKINGLEYKNHDWRLLR